MTRPQTVQDVFDALARDRLVESARLSAFAERCSVPDVPGVLARLVAEGLLTEFQAGEVAIGNSASLWLGNYRALDRLGRGGMGSVFLAEHAVLGKRVAVKVLSAALRADPGARKRFFREARAAATLDHPNIVAVFDVDMAHDPPFLVMEHVDGVSLQEAVARGGTFAAGEVAAVAVQVADGLARAASVGLVHRDIKPANLLVDRRGAVKILDLGIARFAQDDANSRINGTEVILGTLDYLAPEQAIDSSEVDTRADIYALGCTLYFLLTGHPPYPGSDLAWKLRAKQTGDPHPLQQLRPDLPVEFSATVHRLMARDRADRYPTPAAVVAALHPWAVPGSDFPHRLFRLTRDSTAHDRAPTEPEPALPDTLRIIKTNARGSSGGIVLVPVSAESGAAGAETKAGDTASLFPVESAEPPPPPAPSALEPSPNEQKTAPGFASPLALNRAALVSPPPVELPRVPDSCELEPFRPAPQRPLSRVVGVVGLIVALAAVLAGVVALIAIAGP